MGWDCEIKNIQLQSYAAYLLLAYRVLADLIILIQMIQMHAYITCKNGLRIHWLM